MLNELVGYIRRQTDLHEPLTLLLNRAQGEDELAMAINELLHRWGSEIQKRFWYEEVVERTDCEERHAAVRSLGETAQLQVRDATTRALTEQ